MPGTPVVYLTSGNPELVHAIAQIDKEIRVELLCDDLATTSPPQLVFVDWLLPTRSGLELCRQLRDSERTRPAHLTMVLETLDADCRRRALGAGADDYVLGPLTAAMVVAKVRGAPPASRPTLHSARLRSGLLTLDPASFQVRHEGQLLSLRPNEFRLLLHFIDHPNRVFSRVELIEHLGKLEEAGDDRTVDVWVGRLRRALKAQGVPEFIRTVRTYGYVFDSET